MRILAGCLVFLCSYNAFANTAKDELLLAIQIRESGQNSAPMTIAENHLETKNPFFKNHQILFFFSSTCGHCHRQAPVLKAWAESAGVFVDARTFDGQPLEEFPNPSMPTTQLVTIAFKGRPISYPAIFITNTNTLAVYPVTFGALSGAQLSERIQELIPKIVNFERGVL
jgi:conjugal transfer pilus assembly protein TraF